MNLSYVFFFSFLAFLCFLCLRSGSVSSTKLITSALLRLIGILVEDLTGVVGVGNAVGGIILRDFSY